MCKMLSRKVNTWRTRKCRTQNVATGPVVQQEATPKKQCQSCCRRNAVANSTGTRPRTSIN